MVNIKKPKQYIKEKLRSGKKLIKETRKKVVLLVYSLDRSIIAREQTEGVGMS